MVLAQSLFGFLRQRHPESRIDVLAPAWTAPLLARMPEVDEAIPMPFKHGELMLGERLRIGRRLRGRGYDWAIVLPRSLKAAVVPFLARVPRRTGFRGEWRYGWLNDVRRLDRARLPRVVDRFVSLGLEPNETLPANFPDPHLVVESVEVESALARLNIVPPDRPILAICAGAEYGPAKRWPADHYAEVARARLARGWDVWLFGTDRDASITREINRLTDQHCLDLAGRTTLAEAIDLMSLNQAVVTNDSGLMHVAAALGRPLVALFGSSDPNYTPPLGTKAEIVYLGLSCSPCFERECPLGHLRCLYDIAPDRTLAALDKVAPAA